MLSRRCQSSQKSENIQTSEVNSKFIFQKLLETCTITIARHSLFQCILQYPFIIFVLKIIRLIEYHFSSNIFVPFPHLSDLYSRLVLCIYQVDYMKVSYTFSIITMGYFREIFGNSCFYVSISRSGRSAKIFQVSRFESP